MILPIIFVLICIWIWHVAAPTHKTKSGAVPTPAKILDAYSDNSRFGEREEEKLEDYELTGEARTARIAEVKATLTELEAESTKMEEASKKAAKEGAEIINSSIAPYKTQLTELRSQIKAAKKERKAQLEALAAKVAAKESSSGALLTLVQDQALVADAEKEKKKFLDDQIKEIRDNPPESIKEAQLAANKVADEIQHFRKRLDILQTSNKEVKKASLLSKVSDAEEALATAEDPKVILAKSKSIVTNRRNAAGVDDQKFAPTATIAWQTKRSLATVFVGFFIAAAIAIPVGISGPHW